MLRVTNLIGFAAGRTPVTGAFGSVATAVPASADPTTFTSMTFPGDATSERLIVAAISGAAVSNDPIDSVTIGGVSATQVVRASGTFGAGPAVGFAEIWVANVPTGASGNVVISGFGESAGVAIGCATYGINNALSSTASSSGTDTTSTYDITLQAGFAVGVFGTSSDTATASWTNMTEDVDQRMAVPGTDELITTAHATLTGSTTVTVTPTNTNNYTCFAAAAWGP